MSKPEYQKASGGKLYCPVHDIFFPEGKTCWNCDAAEKKASSAPAKPMPPKSEAKPFVVATGK